MCALTPCLVFHTSPTRIHPPPPPALHDDPETVVALTMSDLRRRGKVNRLGLCGTNGAKFPGIRAHMQRAIGDQYRDLDLTMETWPAEEGPRDPAAYRCVWCLAECAVWFDCGVDCLLPRLCEKNRLPSVTIWVRFGRVMIFFLCVSCLLSLSICCFHIFAQDVRMILLI